MKLLPKFEPKNWYEGREFYYENNAERKT